MIKGAFIIYGQRDRRFWSIDQAKKCSPKNKNISRKLSFSPTLFVLNEMRFVGVDQFISCLDKLHEPVCNHGKTSGICKSWPYSLQRSCHEQNRVTLAAGEDEGREEHDDEAEHHREIVADTIDDVAADGVHENLGQKTLFTLITNLGKIKS